MAIKHDNTNLAYSQEFEFFDGNAVTREEREANVAKREALGPRLKEKCVSRRGSWLKAMGLSAVALCSMSVLTYNSIRASSSSYELSALENSYAEEVSRNAELNSKLDRVANLRIAEQQADEYGMNPVEPAQINYLSVGSDNIIVVTDDGSDSISAVIMDWFEDVLEYIGIG